MELLHEIYKGALDEHTNLAEVLRHCVVLGHRLKYDPLKEWANRELNGYSSEDQLPSYRVLNSRLIGNYVIPGYQLKSHAVEMHIFPKDQIKDLLTISLKNEIAVLQAWEKDDPIRLSPNHNNLENYITSKIGHGQYCTSVWLELDRSQIVGLLSQIRNRIMEFVLNIEDEIGGAPLSQVASQPQTLERVDNLFLTNVFGDVANVVSGTGRIVAPQTTIVVNVQRGDRNSLREFLVRQNIATEDIDRLEDLLKEDPEALTLDQGSGIGEWVQERSEQAGRGLGEVGKQAVKESVKVALMAAIRDYAPLIGHAAQHLLT